MSTDFEDRIARLNAKNGPQASEPAADPQGAPRRSRPSRSTGSIATYILVGILILVVMPVSAAMGTIYFAQGKDNLAVMRQP